MPIADALRLTIQLLDGLAELHKLGAVHRDLKPENCLIVQRQGRDHLILLDLGLAKIHTGPLLSLAPSSAPGAMIGTLAYVSPEQAREQRITPAADIYAVGVILFELLTRRVPFPGTTALEVLSAHASEMAPSVTARAPDRGISDDLEALVASSLEKDPARRPENADAFRRALEAAAGQVAAPEDGYEYAKASLTAWRDCADHQALVRARLAAEKNAVWSPLVELIEIATDAAGPA
ncbi:MAG: serine/threonine protein kinase [Nannocystis sp.]|nr:serine/threonine protein kinase [Nannocystis sp.]